MRVLLYLGALLMITSDVTWGEVSSLKDDSTSNNDNVVKNTHDKKDTQTYTQTDFEKKILTKEEEKKEKKISRQQINEGVKNLTDKEIKEATRNLDYSEKEDRKFISQREYPELVRNDNIQLGNIVDELKSDCMIVECNLADFLLDAYFEHSVRITGSAYANKADRIIVMLNGGALQNSIAKGEYITEKVLSEKLMDPIRMGRLSLSGSVIKGIIERAIWNYDGRKSHAEFLQVSGLIITIDPSKPPGQRLHSVYVKHTSKELDNEQKYIVVISRHMCEDLWTSYYGLDSNQCFHNFTEFGGTILSVTVEKIKRLGNVTKKVDGRITILASNQSHSQSSSSKASLPENKKG